VAPDSRSQRFYSEKNSSESHRTCFQRDRDRILYSGYFRRLAVITQVVSPEEGFWVHNRLTHVLKVAQIGRRIAERLCVKTEPELLQCLGGLDPDVVETACLAHDLGHPPFGHVAEELLDKLASASGLADGFEGNAQSFRVVTVLERKSKLYSGLNLTRASLNAILKYPWHRSTDGGKKSRKWGAYHSEEAIFDFARKGSAPNEKSLEADLMDWSDDIAYSVHDLEDFYLLRKIPLHRLLREEEEQNRFLSGAMRRLHIHDEGVLKLYRETAREFFGSIPVTDSFSGSPRDLAGIRSYSSFLFGKLIRATRIDSCGLSIEEKERRLVNILKQLTWHYVIEDESLAIQQEGQKEIIRTLYDIYREAPSKLFPPEFRERAEETKGDKDQRIRVVLDMICSLTEQQCSSLFRRLTGVALGSFSQR